MGWQHQVSGSCSIWVMQYLGRGDIVGMPDIIASQFLWTRYADSLWANWFVIDTGISGSNIEVRWGNSDIYFRVMINTLGPRQNGRYFADDVLKCIFLNENVWIPVKISLQFVPKGAINNIPSLVQIMAWRRQGDKPLSEPMMGNSLSLTHICVTRPQWVNYIFTRLAVKLNVASAQHLICCFAEAGFNNYSYIMIIHNETVHCLKYWYIK